jgi:hypothetical protein
MVRIHTVLTRSLVLIEKICQKYWGVYYGYQEVVVCGVGEKDSDLEVVVYIVGDPSRDHGDSQGEAPVAAKPPLIVRASIQRPESLIHVLWPKVRE